MTDLELLANYEAFLRDKSAFAGYRGFDVDPDDLHPILLPHQRALVAWALRGGRRAIFASFGLGKSVIQLELARQIGMREPGRQLIVCPLGVRQEFARDARNLLQIDTRFVRWSDDVGGDGIYLTNYESIRDGRLDPQLFNCVSLDESSVLRSFGSKTYQTFLTLFDSVPFRFVATATPSPNRYKELIHYAGFLGIMDTGTALTRWFQRNSEKANDLTLYPHKEAEFRLWMHSWACFLTKPSDLGYPDTGYDLPPLETHWTEVAAAELEGGIDRDGQGRIFTDASSGVSEAARAKRATLHLRLDRMLSILDDYGHIRAGGPTDDQVVIWVDLNAEQRAVEKALAQRGLSYSSIDGSLSTEEVERRLEMWRDHQTYALVAKPVMLGEGVNLQQCNKAIFLGITYKFHDLVQAIHRIQRFGQTRPCHVHILFASTERAIRRELTAKWERHRELVAEMSELIREYALDGPALAEAMRQSIGVERVEASGEGWLYAHNDTVVETATMDTDSVDLVVSSIPFGTQYEYVAGSMNDFGHTDDNDHFWAQMDFLTPQLLRVLRPGRMYCCHVKDRILFGNVTGAGASTVSPFHAEAIMHGIKHGFDYMGMITVVTDVVRENNQSYRLGWTEVCKDSTKMGVGSPEYVLLFRKPQSDRTRGYADTPVTHDKADYTRARWQLDAHAYWRCDGNRHLVPEDLDGLTTGERMKLFERWTSSGVYDFPTHVKLGEHLEGKGVLPATFMAIAPASPHPDVWTEYEIHRMRTLNGDQTRRGLANHVCPLPLNIVDRLIERYSNPGELVYDPFGGLGTVPVRALELGRRGRGVELNGSYFGDAVRYLVAAERKVHSPTLFDLVEMEAAEDVGA